MSQNEFSRDLHELSEQLAGGELRRQVESYARLGIDYFFSRANRGLDLAHRASQEAVDGVARLCRTAAERVGEFLEQAGAAAAEVTEGFARATERVSVRESARHEQG